MGTPLCLLLELEPRPKKRLGLRIPEGLTSPCLQCQRVGMATGIYPPRTVPVIILAEKYVPVEWISMFESAF